MIMPQLGYREMTSADFPSWDAWVDAVNAAKRYCRSLPKHRVREYRFKCPAYRLPSFHPYWRMMGARDMVKVTARHAENLRKCEADPSLVPVLYNSNTTLKDIRDRVDKGVKRRQCW